MVNAKASTIIPLKKKCNLVSAIPIISESLSNKNLICQNYFLLNILGSLTKGTLMQI